MFFAFISWESSKMISERNRLRKLTGQYYDIDIINALKRMENEKQAIDSSGSQVNDEISEKPVATSSTKRKLPTTGKQKQRSK